MHRQDRLGTFYGPATLVELLRHRAACQPEDLAYIFLVDGEEEEVSVTYQELDRQARAIGAWLESHVAPGQRALLLYPPGLEFITAFFGCLYAGVVAVPAYPPRRNRSVDRIRTIVNDAEAQVTLTTDQVLNRVAAVVEETEDLKHLTWLATCNVGEGIENSWKMPDVQAETLAFLQYTSGSTGSPKGVILNHANLIHNSALIAHLFEHTRTDRGVFWLPSYHDMGLIGGILQPLYVGRPNVLMSPMSFLQKPYRWLSAISRYRGSTSGGPNFAYDLCVRKITPEQRATLDLSCWKVAFNGAEPVRDDTIEAFSKAFAPCGFRRSAFYPCFGLAEATLIVSGGYITEAPVIRAFDSEALNAGRALSVDPQHPSARRLVGCGKAAPDERVVIANPETRAECPPGEIGEIWVSGPSVAQGYWRQADATKQTFQAYLADSGAGPFLRTGDLGFLADGELFVAGRIKDLIIVRGVNYYPQDIEFTVARANDRLREESGAVFTIEDGSRQRLVAVQEVERRHKIDHQVLFADIRRAVMAQHDLPLDAIVLIKAGSIPKTSSGKIQRHACRKGYLEGTLDVVAQWNAPEDAAQAEPVAPKPAPPEATTAPVEPGVSEQAPPPYREPDLPARYRAAQPAAVKRNGNGAVAPSHKRETVTEIVLEEVRRVAKERATGMTMDSVIAELGLDSLERMEIVASLEERFGGRFPEEVLPEMETCRQVIEAVEKYLGGVPRSLESARPRDAEIPPETYRIEKFPEYVKLRQSLDLLESTGLGNPYFNVHQGITNDRTMIDGREMINFSSYNYLGMSGDPEVIRATQEAVARYGTSVSASRLVSGQKPLHVELERTIASFVGTEDAIVFVGGHSTNETVIGHLFSSGDLILHDALSHNSILQGALLSSARRRPFAHNDWRVAAKLLELYRHDYRRVLLVIEGVYSMDGDHPDLPRFIEVAKAHQALLMVDEAHSAGTMGRLGRGLGEHFNVDRRDVDIWMGTLSKSFGSCGGYVAGSRQLVEYLKYTAPGFVYSVGLSPPNAAAALASFQLLQREPQRVAQLQRQSRLFLTLARQRGLNTGMSQDSPVVPVILGNSMYALRLSKALYARGINVQPILYPAVEESAARLRFFLTALHTDEQIHFTVDTLAHELEAINPDYVAGKVANDSVAG